MWYNEVKREISEAELGRRLKTAVKSSSFLRKMFDHYGVPISEINTLDFKVTNLGGKLAKVDEKSIYFDVSLFRDGSFHTDRLHVVAHQICQWLKKITKIDEGDLDPEPYAVSIAYEISQGTTDVESLEQKIMPFMRHSCSGLTDCNLFFVDCLKRAKLMLRK